MEFNHFLAQYCPDPPAPWHVPDVPLEAGEEPAGIVYRGTVRSISVFADPCCEGFRLGQDLPEGFAGIQEFTLSPYRIVWKNDALRTIVTYCEGDIPSLLTELTSGMRHVCVPRTTSTRFTAKAGPP
jgi:hypothetical protein